LEPVEVEIDKPSGPRGGTGDDPTPADVLMALIEKVKAAREAAREARRAAEAADAAR
jgi:hypothetical protein